MMTTQYLSATIALNPNQLTPWHSQTLPTSTNPKNRHLPPFIQQTSTIMNKSSFPKVIRTQAKSQNKQQKIHYQLAKKQLLPDHKTFQIIKTARETSFNGFITKYKGEPKSKNRRYLMVTKGELLNSSLQLSEQVKFINLSSLQNRYEEEIVDLSRSHRLRQFQFSRKRSLSNIIRSVGKGKFVRLKQPCVHSPWMVTNSISAHKQCKEKEAFKPLRNIKLMQLDLGIHPIINPKPFNT